MWKIIQKSCITKRYNNNRKQLQRANLKISDIKLIMESDDFKKQCAISLIKSNLYNGGGSKKPRYSSNFLGKHNVAILKAKSLNFHANLHKTYLLKHLIFHQMKYDFLQEVQYLKQE